MADPINQQGLYQDGNSIFENVHILGTLNVSGIVTSTTTISASKFIGDGSELSGIDATTIKDSTGTTQIQGTTTGATHSGRAVFNEIEIGGKLYDADGDFGTSGQVLASDGTNTNWVNTGSLTAGAASEVGVTAVSTNADHFLTFVDSSTGNENVKVDTDLKYNPFTNTLGAINIASAVVNGNFRISGELQDGDGNFGGAGTVLTSDGTDTKWDNVGNLAAGSAAKLSVTENDTETDGRLLFSNAAGQSGGNEVKSDNDLTYNANTNVLTGGTFAGNISGGDGTFNDLTINGELIDGDGSFGSSGQVLSSDGTDTRWVNAGTLTAGAASEVGVNETNTTDSTHFPVFVEASSGNEEVRVDTGFTYNPNSGTLTATTFSGTVNLTTASGAIANPARLANNVIAAGRLQTNSVVSGNIVDNAVTFAKLQDVPQSHLIGRIATGSGDATFLNTSQIKSMLGTITQATNATNIQLSPNNDNTNFHCLFSMSSFQTSAQNASVLFDSGSFTYNPSDNRLNLSKLQVHQISPTSTYDAGSANQILIATGGTPGIDWGPAYTSFLRSDQDDTFSGKLTNASRNESPEHSRGCINLKPSASGGSTGIIFDSNSNFTSDHGYLWWYDDNNNYAKNTATGENGAFVIGVQNDANATTEDAVAIESTGDIFLNPGMNDNSYGGASGPNFTRGKVYVGRAASRNEVYHTGNLPTIPTNNNQLTNGAGYVTSGFSRTIVRAFGSSTTYNPTSGTKSIQVYVIGGGGGSGAAEGDTGGEQNDYSASSGGGGGGACIGHYQLTGSFSASIQVGGGGAGGPTSGIGQGQSGAFSRFTPSGSYTGNGTITANGGGGSSKNSGGGGGGGGASGGFNLSGHQGHNAASSSSGGQSYSTPGRGAAAGFVFGTFGKGGDGKGPTGNHQAGQGGSGGVVVVYEYIG